MRLCKFCKFCKPDNLTLFHRWEFATCVHPKAIKRTDLVDGRKESYQCSTMRYSTDTCGLDAKLFESRI